MGDAEEENACIAEVFDFKEKKKKNKKKTAKKRVTFAENEANSPTVVNNDGNEDSAAAASGVRISLFDFSVENFFRDMDTIARLCGKENGAALDQSEVQRLSSSVTFLRYKQTKQFDALCIEFLINRCHICVCVCVCQRSLQCYSVFSYAYFPALVLLCWIIDLLVMLQVSVINGGMLKFHLINTPLHRMAPPWRAFLHNFAYGGWQQIHHAILPLRGHNRYLTTPLQIYFILFACAMQIIYTYIHYLLHNKTNFEMVFLRTISIKSLIDKSFLHGQPIRNHSQYDFLKQLL